MTEEKDLTFLEEFDLEEEERASGSEPWFLQIELAPGYQTFVRNVAPVDNFHRLDDYGGKQGALAAAKRFMAEHDTSSEYGIPLRMGLLMYADTVVGRDEQPNWKGGAWVHSFPMTTTKEGVRREVPTDYEHFIQPLYQKLMDAFGYGSPKEVLFKRFWVEGHLERSPYERLRAEKGEIDEDNISNHLIVDRVFSDEAEVMAATGSGIVAPEQPPNWNEDWGIWSDYFRSFVEVVASGDSFDAYLLDDDDGNPVITEAHIELARTFADQEDIPF